MPLNEYLSTYANSFNSTKFVMYRYESAGRKFLMCGLVTNEITERGVVRLTVQPISEYYWLTDSFEPTLFNRAHKVNADDVIDVWVVPAAAVS